MAMAHYRLGHMDDFDVFMRRHVDAEIARLSLKANPSQEDQYNLHRLKKQFTDMSSRYGGSLHIFGNSYDNGDYLSSFTAEIKKTGLEVGGYRTELFFKVGGTLTSLFTGEYFDYWSGRDMPYSGSSHLDDTIYAGLGARLFPFTQSDFNLGVQQNFEWGRETENDTILFANIYEDIGGDWEPFLTDWTFASLYSQLNYSTRENNFTYYGDLRLGRSFCLGSPGGLWVLTPFVGVSGDYGGKMIDKGSRWGLETGPGFVLRKWLAEDDPYKVPVASIDFSLQYRFGLSHERKDVLTGALYFSF